MTYTGDITNIINNHIQGNKVGTFLSSIYIDNGQEKFRVKRSADIDNEGDLKKILFWNEANGSHSNTTGIDAPFKKLYDNNFI
ncbi:hypothetical protein [Aeromonas salmonicida]|uniref:hypothetical protein n=1 Tax=Aeromonas salmonicida TaxID=645 RepID=UPI001F257F5C|nr:hypothetical protein [Aeromonas salmonicida]